MQEDSGAIFILPEQYSVTPSQPSQGDPRRRSYPRNYLAGTSSTSEQVQYSSDTLGRNASNLGVPSNAGYHMFDGQSASLFQQQYAHLLILNR
jgi:hypothetical protein